MLLMDNDDIRDLTPSDALNHVYKPAPKEDEWRLPLLEKLLKQRYEMEIHVQDTDAIQELIDSLCSS